MQALGGSAAAAAANSHKSAKAGSDIMLAGIIFQTGVLSADGMPDSNAHSVAAAITLYVVLGAEFLYRVVHDKPIRGRDIINTGYTFDRKMRLMVGSLIFSSLCFYVR